MTKENDKALTTRGPNPVPVSIYDNVGNPLEACKELGKWLYQSKLGGCENEAQATVLAWSAMMQKKDPLEIAAKNHIIKGKLSKKADEMQAEYLERGGKCKWLKMEKKHVEARFTKGDNDLVFSFTWADAEEAGYVYCQGGSIKDNYKNDSMAMLKARVISRAVGVLDPRVKVGYYTPEEIVDMPGKATPETPASSSGSTAFGGSQEQAAGPVETEAEVVESGPVEVPPDDPKTALKKMVDELCVAFEDKTNDVEKYLVAAGWVQPGESIPSLDKDRVERLYNNQSGFILAVDQFTAGIKKGSK